MKSMENYDRLETLSIGVWQDGWARFQRWNVSGPAATQGYQLALSNNLSAPSQPEMTKHLVLKPSPYVHINPFTFTSVSPTLLLLYFSFQPGWCKLLCLGVLYVWSQCQSGIMPVLSLLLSWLEWVGMYHKVELGAREANGCIPPSTSTFIACLPQSVFYTILLSLFVTECYTYIVIWVTFFFFISRTS